MIHEKQNRQFCAIHSVNNLLQLSEDYSDCADSLSISNDSCQQLHVINEWRCHGRLLYHHQQELKGSSSPTINNDTNKASGTSEKMNWGVVATQAEFNDIAEEITNRELMLMDGYDITTSGLNNCTSENQSANTLSTIQRLRSKHFSPVSGNYSYEVLETALIRRGVAMEYYRVDTDKTDSPSETLVDRNPNIIGFIVHEEETSADFFSYLRRLGSHVPIIRNLCEGGRHWWVITGVKRSCFLSGASKDETFMHTKEQKVDNKEWHHIDSNFDHILEMSSADELMSTLRAVQSRGALIFSCSVIDQ